MIKERPVTIYLNGRELVTLLCAGHHLEELAVGFLYGEGFIKGREDVKDVLVDPSAGKIEVKIQGRLWMEERRRKIVPGRNRVAMIY